jgi:hypothetical protein
MPIRRLPRTDEERASALNLAKKRKDEVPAAEVPMSASTNSRLDTLQPLFRQALIDRGTALRDQATATAATDPERARLRMFISHFFQSFNNAVARGMFAAEDRAYYQLDINSDAVPPLDSDEKLVTWAGNLLSGDAQRVAAGGEAMAMPTAAQVQVVFDQYQSVTGVLADRKAAYDAAQERVAGMRTVADSLIVRMWNEIEAAYSEDEAPSKRRKARQWGVVYISSPGEGTEKEGELAAGARINLFRNLDAETDITVRNTGTVDLLFYRATSADDAPAATGRTVLAGEELTLPFSEFGTLGNFLNVANQTDAVGSYVVKVEGV